MKKSTKVIVATAVGLSILGGATAIAHSKHGAGFGYGGHRGHMIEHIGERLALTTDQEGKLDSVFKEMRDMRREMMRNRRESMEQISELLNAPVLDQQAALELFTAKVNTVEQRAPGIIAAIADFADSLTPQQKEEVREMMQQRIERHGYYRE